MAPGSSPPLTSLFSVTVVCTLPVTRDLSPYDDVLSVYSWGKKRAC